MNWRVRASHLCSKTFRVFEATTLWQSGKWERGGQCFLSWWGSPTAFGIPRYSIHACYIWVILWVNVSKYAIHAVSGIPYVVSRWCIGNLVYHHGSGNLENSCFTWTEDASWCWSWVNSMKISSWDVRNWPFSRPVFAKLRWTIRAQEPLPWEWMLISAALTYLEKQ